MDFSEMELGPKMQACDERERKFVWFYIINGDGNASQAARDAGYADAGPDSASIRVRAHSLLHRDRVLAALEEVGRKSFRGLLAPAVLAQARMIANEKHPDHAKVVQSTLSRLGLGERTGVDVNVSGEVTINQTDAALEDLRILVGAGVPREKLIETFGFSGLSRYEKMLQEQDSKRLPALKQIEGEVVDRG
jgi:hypothetical protein